MAFLLAVERPPDAPCHPNVLITKLGMAKPAIHPHTALLYGIFAAHRVE